MSTTAADPKTPETKPHGTTEDQIKEMESEGQAATSQATPEETVESPNTDQVEGARGPVRSSLDKTMSDQDIDTAGTEADRA